jgi:hypothetical protein
MQRNGSGSLTGWAFASIPFPTSPGIGWRLHMSRIAREILPGRTPPSRRRLGIFNLWAT